MADIFQDFPIKASRNRVFQAVSTPSGLDTWWTKRAAGKAMEGAEYELWFGPQYDWRAKVTRCIAHDEFELQMVVADDDWLGTRVGFRLEDKAEATWVRFYHAGWPSQNEHFRISCHCWAMYLRILRRYLEHNELVAYDDRLDA